MSMTVMMNESKLTSFQQRQLRETMRAGGTLPLVCNPTTSSPGGGDLSKKTPSKRQKRLSKQGVRTKETIEGMVDNEPDYKPAPASEFITIIVHTTRNLQWWAL